MFLLTVCLAAAASARLLHSVPEDPYTFPKFRVAFLNGLPVLNQTAQRWLDDGLRGGELEFLDQPWKDHTMPSHLKEIGTGDEPTSFIPEPTPGNYTLEHMKLGPRNSYLCLIPKPVDNVPAVQEQDSDADVTPARSWSLLQPLLGTCLYHRQGWFTYSYCHNDEIRQFKELLPAQPRFPGTYKPEEDPEWESYTLGQAPRNTEAGADLTVAEQSAQAANLELARSAGSRYLVQRWADGTICDKTGNPREVEVQFHCSMEMTDHILFVKETRTCSYVLVLHTPRLCGEPGFKSSRDATGEAEIRCREVVDTQPEGGQQNLPTADHPVKFPLRKTVLPAPQPGKGDNKNAVDPAKEKLLSNVLRKTLEVLVGGEDAEYIIELPDDELEGGSPLEGDQLVEAFRAAGFDVRAEYIDLSKLKVKKDSDETSSDSRKRKAPAKKQPDPHRDEL